MSGWGSNNDNASKPKFPWLVTGGGATANNQDNVHATEKGWVYNHPWGQEVLVGIGGLAPKLDVSNSPSPSVSPSKSPSASVSSSPSPSKSPSASVSASPSV